MRPGRLEQVVRAAVDAGLLPAAAAGEPVAEQRPWPVVLLTGLGAWLAAMPLLSVASLVLEPLLEAGVGAYAGAAVLLGAALVVLRLRTLGLFAEQLAVPVLLVGAGLLGIGLFRDLPHRPAAVLLALALLAVAALVARHWLRALLGAAAAALVGLAALPEAEQLRRTAPDVVGWVAAHVMLAAWAAAMVLQARAPPARHAAAVEAVAAGWLAATLAALALLSGMTFLLGAVVGGAGAAQGGAASAGPAWQGLAVQAASAALGLAGAAVAGRRWPALRQPATAGVALVLLALCAYMSALGGALLALALAATTRRRVLAGCAALAAAWIVGAFYYQLRWPLATKALVLVLAGATSAALAVLPYRRRPRAGVAAPPAAPHPTRSAWGAGLCLAAAAATLAVANVSIWQKEQLIAHGQPVFVALAPVDPRSLMQGDFMRLNFEMPAALRRSLDTVATSERPRVVARRDERGIATILRRAEPGAALGPGELLIELAPKGGRWVLVTDAWFFREGEAQRWQAAKFGEFRVAPDGSALLVGLRGEALRPL